MQNRGINIVLLVLFLFPAIALGQEVRGLEAGADYTHLSGDQGYNGFGATAGYRFSPHVTLFGDGDFLWSNSTLHAFGVTSNFAHISGNEQNFLGGGRFHILSWKPAIKQRQLLPFAELLFGVSRLSQTVTSAQAGTASASSTAFTWVLGGGVDYTLAPKWIARGSLDLARTHFGGSGQSRYRVGLGFAHVF